MKRISFSFKLVSSAARSPCFSMAGPEVTRMFTFISFAMMVESVVLPRPGGPYSSTWSRFSPRIRAASMYTRRFSLALSWPMYSSSVLGRRENSVSASAPVYSGVTMRFSRSKSKLSMPCLPLSMPSQSGGELLQARPDQILHRQVLGTVGQRRSGLRLRITQRRQSGDGLAPVAGAHRRRDRGRKAPG